MQRQKIKFSKMHGLGNDFIVINNIKKNINICSNIIRRLSSRHRGIGFDQLLIVEKSEYLGSDFYYRIFNADGKEVNQCGNGARCFARFVFLKKLTNKNSINVTTKDKIMNISNINTDEILVNIGEPTFDPKNVPFLIKNYKKNYTILVNNKTIVFSVVSVGNPHCVIQVKNINDAPVNEIGPALEKHILFPENVNVGFMEVVTKNKINLRVYERGVGETQACGSGACAASAIGILQNFLDKNVEVNLLGGTLQISWEGIGYPMYMKGSATHVYDGFVFI